MRPTWKVTWRVDHIKIVDRKNRLKKRGRNEVKIDTNINGQGV